MRNAALIIVTVISTVLPGCARLTTYNKSIDLESGSVAIDAKQRVIFSKTKVSQRNITEYDPTGTKVTKTYPEETTVRLVCAEPSPDALAVLGATGALTGSDATGNGGAISAGLAEAAASIGLRTQSIQLLRDLNYRICEAYANDAIGFTEVTSLLRRGQSTMMGLIAIEQLTGPVVASQAALIASANAGTGGASSDTTAAQSAVTAAQDAFLAAQAEVDSAETERDSNRSAVDDASAKVAAAMDAENPDQAGIDSLRSNLKTAQQALSHSEDKLQDKERRAKTKEQNLKDALVQLSEAKRGKTGSATLTGAELTELAKENAKATTELASQVRNIVSDINQSYLRDGCFSLITDLAQQPGQQLSQKLSDPRFSSPLKAALNTCTTILADNPAPTR